MKKSLFVALLLISVGAHAENTICSDASKLNQITVWREETSVRIYEIVAVSMGIRDGQRLETDLMLWKIMKRNMLLQLDIILCLIDKEGTEI